MASWGFWWSSWHPLLVDIFGRVIADEAQKIKNTKSISFQSVKGLGARITCLLTATPMINKPADLHGLLSMVWKKEWADGQEDRASAEDYDEAMQEVNRAGLLCQDNIEDFLWVLNPSTFASHTIAVQTGGQMDPLVASQVIPVILSVFQLRRTMAHPISDVNGKDMRVGDEIPPTRWVSVELEMGDTQLAQYAKIHGDCAPWLGMDAQLADLTYARRGSRLW